MKKTLLALIAAAILLTATLPTSLQAQNRNLIWKREFLNQDINHQSNHGQNLNYHYDNIVTAVMDSAGNTYLLGMTGNLAEWDGQVIFPDLDDSYFGYFLTKIDTIGRTLWLRTTYRQRSLEFWGMVIKNGRIYIGMNEEDRHAPYYFFGTLHTYKSGTTTDTTYGEFPYERDGVNAESHTRFVVFDTDGNLLEHHRIDMQAPNYILDIINGTDTFYANDLYLHLGDGLFDVDSKGNLYILTNIGVHFEEPAFRQWEYSIIQRYLGWKQERPLRIHTINYHDSTTTTGTFSTGLEDRYTAHNSQTNAATIIKIDSSWEHLECIPLIDHATGWSRDLNSDTATWMPDYDNYLWKASYPITMRYKSFNIDDEDNLYLTGYMKAGFGMTTNYSHLMRQVYPPCLFYLDSLHWLTAENYPAVEQLPFSIKCDTAGKVHWVNQLYCETENPDHFWNRFHSHTLTEKHVYVLMEAYNVDTAVERYFFDSTHLDTITTPQRRYGSRTQDWSVHYAMYDKNTGELVKHHILDTLARCSDMQSSLNIIQGTVSAGLFKFNTEYSGTLAAHVVSYNPWQDVRERSDSIELFTTRYNQKIYNALLHPHGFLLLFGKQGIHSGYWETPPDLEIPENSAFLRFYYDSTLDTRWRRSRIVLDSTTIPHITLGINPVATDGGGLFTLSPNPTTGKVTVSVGHTPQSLTHSSVSRADSSPNLGEQLVLTVRDAVGREVLRKEFSIVNCQFSIPLDLSGLPSGTYFVMLTTSTVTATQRLVVK